MTAQPSTASDDTSKFAAIREPLDSAHHLPGSIYVTDEFWDREKSEIFTKEWLMVCRSEQLAKSGDFITLRIMGEPVLVARARDGKIRAFANVCRHRGVEVARGTGNTPVFVCPYHAWTYDLTGELKSAPFMGAGRNAPEDCNLKEFAVSEWRNNVFVSLAETPRDFDAFIAPFDKEFGFLQLENTRWAKTVEFEMKCNWKLSLENLIDIYHVGTVHAKTFGGFYRNKDDHNFTVLPDGSTSMFAEAAPLTSTGESLTGNIPWLADQSSGLAAIGLLWPNFRFSARIDYYRIWNIWPLAPDRTLMRMFMLFPEAAFAAKDFEANVERYAEFIRIAIEEDREMIESLQLGVASQNFVPGPLADLEIGIHNYLNHYSEVVRG